LAPSFDIFCRVVDNYGDIGVCWRLARLLSAAGAGMPVRLWVDDLAAFARIAPHVDPNRAAQTVQGVDVRHWAGAAAAQPAQVVIEAFACTPPTPYLHRLTARQVWINLEYLSAEEWVESCHGLPSLQPGGLRKFFFFPGFSSGTGGLLREPDLIARRDAWQADPAARLALLDTLGVEADWLERLRKGARLVYVFCYPDAPLAGLMNALAELPDESLVLMPEGTGADVGRALPRHPGVHVHAHRFVDQPTFDTLLWSADLNFVRGEDSLVRALWAGRPMVWQAYRQESSLHLQKLDAWLERTPFSTQVRALMHGWNVGDDARITALLPQLLQPDAMREWAQTAQTYCTGLQALPELADSLGAFCAEHA